MKHNLVNGVINHDTARKTDFLYRVSLKALIRDDGGRVLVVREKRTTWWDLPGGGIDHGESVAAALAREINEEVGYEGEFTYKIIAIDEKPDFVDVANSWQIRLIFELFPANMNFTLGNDAEEIMFVNPDMFIGSDWPAEQRIAEYIKALDA